MCAFQCYPRQANAPLDPCLHSRQMRVDTYTKHDQHCLEYEAGGSSRSLKNIHCTGERFCALHSIFHLGLNERLNAKRRIVRQYNEYFSTTDLILPPHIPDNVDHAWYMYPPSFDESVDRDQVVRLLAADNIETRTSFPPVHTQPYFQQRFS